MDPVRNLVQKNFIQNFFCVVITGYNQKQKSAPLEVLDIKIFLENFYVKHSTGYGNRSLSIL